MALVACCLIAGLVAGVATGGRLSALARPSLRGSPLLLLGLGLQIAADRGFGGQLALLGGYAALMAFTWLNRTVAGMGVVALGLAANGMVVTIDAGMPVRPAALVAAGVATPATLEAVDYGGRHHAERPSDRLRLLGDVIPLPPLREVVSFGDLVLAAGAADVVAHRCHDRTRRGRHRPRPPSNRTSAL